MGRLAPWVWLVVVAQFAALVATSTRYGYHRDELYFIAAGSHPAFGYPDQPSIVPLLSRLMQGLDPGSLLVLRLPSALAAATTTVIAALVARELGGSRRAQTIAAACTASSGFALAVGHFVSTTTFDLLSTTAVGWLLVRAILHQSGLSLLAAGIVTGIGSEAKPQVLLVAAVFAAALVVLGPRRPLISWWGAGAVAAAVLGILPYAVWQQIHGWPQLTVAGNIAGSAEGGRAGFIPFQLVLVSPVLVPVWIAGLLAPFRRPALRSLRFVPVAYAALAVVYIAGNGKAYYLASLYPLLLGLGAVPVAAWTLRARRGTALLATAIGLSAAIGGLIALPLLPETSLQGSIVMAVNPDQGETVGWPAFIDAVAGAWRAIPAVEQQHTALFTSNYGEAGAIDLLGASHGLPRAYSGHNGFGEWGRPASTDTRALIVGYDDPADASPYFTGCRKVAAVDNGVGLDNQEQGLPLLLCRPARSWVALWPHLRHLG